MFLAIGVLIITVLFIVDINFNSAKVVSKLANKLF